MQKKVLLLLSVSGLLFVRHPVLANDIEPSKEFYTVIYTPQSIALNGVQTLGSVGNTAPHYAKAKNARFGCTFADHG